MALQTAGTRQVLRRGRLGFVAVVVALCAAACTDGHAPAPEPQALRSFGPAKFAGRVRAIVVHPTNPNRIWLAGATGGIWLTDNGGDNWRPADDFLPTLTFSSLAIDPKNPNVLYAGTGELYSTLQLLHQATMTPAQALEANEGDTLRSPRRGTGILKSTDGGESWAPLANTTRPEFRYVSRIAVHPTKPEIVLAATSSGLWRSQNGGASWEQLPELANKIVLDVRFHPSPNVTTANAVAGTYDNGAFASTDGDGLKWTQSILPASIAAFTNTRVELAPAPVPATTPPGPGLWLAAHIRAEGNGQTALIGSSDGGLTFKVVNEAANLGCPVVDAPKFNNRLYTGALWVDPTNASNVVVGGIELCRSRDGGLTFSTVVSTHNDHQVIVGDPSTKGRVYVGHDGGIDRFDNVGAVATPAVVSRNQDLQNQQFHGAAMNPSTGIVYGGAQDLGVLRRDTAGVWTDILGGRAGSDSPSPSTDGANPGIWYYGKSLARLFRRTDGATTHVCISRKSPNALDDANDDGACDRTAPPLPASHCFGITYTPVIIDVINRKTLYVGCKRLWRTKDATVAPESVVWEPIKPVPADGGTHAITTLAQSRSNANVMWLGTFRTGEDDPVLVPPAPPERGGEVWVTRTLGSLTSTSPEAGNWELASHPPLARLAAGSQLPTRMVTSIAVDPQNPDLAYVAFAGWPVAGTSNLWRVIRAADGKYDWAPIVNGLPVAPVWSVAVHPTRPACIYAGSDEGLYASHDRGTTWSRSTLGPARVPVSHLEFSGAGNLVISTYGRGVFVLDQNDASETVGPELILNAVGANLPGNIGDLLRSNERGLTGKEFVVTPTGTTSRGIVVRLHGSRCLGGTRLADFSFTSRIDATSSRVPSIKVELLNFKTNTYVDVTAGAKTSLTAGTTRVVPPAGDAGFVSPSGEVEARVTWSGDQTFQAARVDAASWRVVS